MNEKNNSEKKMCPTCGRPLNGYAVRCADCLRENPPLLAWEYRCLECGISTYSFFSPSGIRDAADHQVKRGDKVIYLAGKFTKYCPICERLATDHDGEIRKHGTYIAVCPLE